MRSDSLGVWELGSWEHWDSRITVGGSGLGEAHLVSPHQNVCDHQSETFYISFDTKVSDTFVLMCMLLKTRYLDWAHSQSSQIVLVFRSKVFLRVRPPWRHESPERWSDRSDHQMTRVTAAFRACVR
jgi:hypothetical protein